MISTRPHQPICSSRKAAWQGYALTHVGGTVRRDGRSSAFLGQKGLVGLSDRATIEFPSANPGGSLP